MKKKELQELRVKSIKEKHDVFSNKRSELKRAILDAQSGTVKNTSILRNLRRVIAQINTLIKEEELQERIK